MSDGDLVTICGLKRTLGLSYAFLEGEIKAGRIPYLQAGKVRLFNVPAVKAALAKQAAAGGGEGGGNG